MPRVGGLWGHGFAVIDDDDAGPTVRAGSAEATETDGSTIAEVPLVLSAPSSEIVEVEWDAVANTARPGSDFASASGTAVFAPGETQTTVSIEILGDDVPEPKELVVLALRSATNAQIGGWLGLGFAHITDDD